MTGPARAAILLAGFACGLLGACDLTARPVRDAAWYRANKEALATKLEDCKRDPQGALIDAECAAASQAFSIWHVSQAYLADREALSAKLAYCKAHPQVASKDVECTAAQDAFIRWYSAHQKADRAKVR